MTHQDREERVKRFSQGGIDPAGINQGTIGGVVLEALRHCEVLFSDTNHIEQ